jgi:mono/diheme cytochrome c family protein
MKRTLVLFVWMAGVLLLAGCGGSGGGDQTGAPSVQALASPLDAGPRAGEAPVSEALVERGAGLFKSKGCSACHAFGKKVACPDLKGVTMRRTSEWMQNQILHPEIMTKNDPISHKLLAEYMKQMPNQGLTQDEALMVIEYFKHMDHELGVIP